MQRSELVQVLIEDPSEINRSRAHAQLGQLALDHDNVDKAVLHFKEAVELDPTDEVSRDALALLTEEEEPAQSAWGRMWSRMTRPLASA